MTHSPTNLVLTGPIDKDLLVQVVKAAPNLAAADVHMHVHEQEDMAI